VNFVVKLFGLKIPYGIDTGALSLVISLTLFIGISLLSKPPKLASDVEGIMEM